MNALGPATVLIVQNGAERDVETDAGFAWSTMDNRGSSETAKPLRAAFTWPPT